MSSLFKQLFSKYLIITNTVTSGTLLGLGDVITQNVKIEYASRTGVTGTYFDIYRTGRMFLMGLMIGPFGHLWYSKLADKLVLGSGPKVVLKKIGVDQIIFTPFITCLFFGGMGLLEGRGINGALNEITTNFIAVYSVDCCVWPPAQYINFHFIPARFRSVYVSTMTLKRWFNGSRDWREYQKYLSMMYGDRVDFSKSFKLLLGTALLK